MSSLSDRVLPPINDAFLGARVESLRAGLVAQARGRVLEIGAGSGLNFVHYREGVDVIAVEPSEAMRRRAEARYRESAVRAHVTMLDARAKSLPIDAGSVDMVVATFVLCSVRDLAPAFAELARVLKPGGSLLVLEHCVDPDPSIARWQRRVQPVWGVLLGGCQLTRDIPAELERGGFDTGTLADCELPLPWIVRHGVMGSALRG